MLSEGGRSTATGAAACKHFGIQNKSLTRVAFCVRNGQKAVRIVAGVRVNVDLAVSPVICDFSIEFMLNSVIPIWSLRT